MAKSTIDVSGLSVQDILNIDISTFNKLNKADMRKLTGRLVSAGNKRLRRFESKGQSTPATRMVEHSGGKFSTKGKNLNELRTEFMRAKTFMEAKTSTQKGWTDVMNSTIKSLREKGVEISREEFESMWEIYEKLKESDPRVAIQSLKYKVMHDTMELSKEGLTREEIVNRVSKDLDRIYQEEAERTNNDGTAQYFEGQ